MKKIILASIAPSLHSVNNGTKGKVLEGNWKAVGNIEKFDLEFDYSTVEVPDFDTEQGYIDQKMKEKMKTSLERARCGENVIFADREQHFEPKFIESFNKRGDWQASKDFDDAAHVLKVEITMLSHGWNVGVMRKAARLDAVIYVYKRGESTPLLKVKYENVKGADAMGYDFATHSRVAEGFAKLAKSFLSDLKEELTNQFVFDLNGIFQKESF